MKRLRVISASDAVNRYGSRFAVEALVSALWDNCEIGNPVLLNHDLTRPIGWSRGVAVHMEPGYSRLVGQHLVPENDREGRQLESVLNGYLQMKLVDERGEEVENLRRLASGCLLGQETPLCRGCVALVEPDLARRALPQLFASEDKDGLVPIGDLTPIGPGVFRVGKFAVFAHRSFRRSFSRLNTLNAPFLRRLYNLRGTQANAKIALDSDMLGLASTYEETVELEYWRGPKFDDDLASIPTGVTRHEARQEELMFHGISRTEFWWQSREKQHIFEAEELRDIPSTSGSTSRYECRYVHSMVHQAKKQVTHFDGAVRSYSEERMVERLDTDIMHFGRNSEYTKLWRIDGIIDVQTWKSLLSDYFKDNRLVGEYLGAGCSEEAEYLTRRTQSGAASERYVPYSVNRGDGLRVSLCFAPRSRGVEERTLLAPEMVAFNNERSRVIEMEAIELKKALEKRGAHLRMPEFDLMKYEDGYTNLPPILHGGACVEEELRGTLDAIGTLVRAWDQQGLDMVVSCSVTFPVEGKEATVSVYGHVRDLRAWFSEPLCYPPTTIEGLRTWSSKASIYLSRNYRVAANKPDLDRTLKETGIFWISRVSLEDSEYTFSLSKDQRTSEYEIKIPKGERDLIRWLESGEISPASAIHVTESECSACRAPYKQCSCSKLLDEGVIQKITNVGSVFMFWTDRPTGLNQMRRTR